MESRHEMAILALPGSEAQASRIADAMALPLLPVENRTYDTGECSLRPLASVRDRDAYLITSLHDGSAVSIHDKLFQLLLLAGAVTDAGAARVTLLAPYLCYGRKDRRTQPRDSVATRYLAQLLEAAGIDRVVSFDVHNRSAFENAFRIPAEALDVRPLLAARMAARLADKDVTVVSPDVGGMRRAELYRRDLARMLDREVSLGFVEKRRNGSAVETSALVGDVEGRTVLIVDDMIVTGSTIGEAAHRCRASGARSVLVAAAHGLLTDKAADILADDGIEQVWLSDTVDPPARSTLRLGSKVEIVPVAPLAAAAIGALNRGEALVPLQGWN